MRAFVFTSTLPHIFQRGYKALLHGHEKKVKNSEDLLSEMFNWMLVAETTSGPSIFILHVAYGNRPRDVQLGPVIGFHSQPPVLPRVALVPNIRM